MSDELTPWEASMLLNNPETPDWLRAELIELMKELTTERHVKRATK